MPKKNGKLLKCECCGKMVYVPKGRWKKFRFCSLVCHGKSTISDNFRFAQKGRYGKNNWRWKSEGCKRKDGYILISVNGKRYFKHRRVMEEHLERKLSFNETVHHLNGNRADNRLENLELNNRSEHTIKYHAKKKKPEKYIHCPVCNKIFYAYKGTNKTCSIGCKYEYSKKYVATNIG